LEDFKTLFDICLFDVSYSSAIYRAEKAPGMGAVMCRRRAVGLPWRRGDQQEATPATFAGQERATCAFERTARPRLMNAPQREQGETMRPSVAASLKLSHQVLFFLPITALTILAIATAMPSDGRLCSRQK